jgi:hypothetical protein
MKITKGDLAKLKKDHAKRVKAALEAEKGKPEPKAKKEKSK